MKQRIWELDAFRGICILGMVVVHLVYDMVDLYRLVDWQYPAAFVFVMKWGGVLFLVLSGICVTLGSHCVKRGAIVFGCGMVCTAVTWGMVKLELAGSGMVIWFGVLHCLGVCMLLWALFKHLPTWATALLGIGCTAAGFLITDMRVSFPWLIPLGLITENFISPDYFPLLPNLGYFLLGAVLGRTLYRRKATLFPGVNPKILPLRFLCACGRHSLWIYLLHQPVLSAIFFAVLQLQGGIL